MNASNLMLGGRRLARLIVVSLASSFVAACAASVDSPQPTADVEVDQTEIVHGVLDRGRNPAVVALSIWDNGEPSGLCTATLIAPDVVLTARHCVSDTTEQVACPADGPQIMGDRRAASLHILVGDDARTAHDVARGREVLVPQSNQLCNEDIAVVLLDREVEGIDPLDVHTQGIAQGGHVTAVGYGKSGDDGGAGVKLRREHVRVLDTSEREFEVGEATCQGDSGGPALDEDSGEIVGVVSRGGPGCDGAGTHNIYTRADAFLALIDEALSRSQAPHAPKKKPKGDPSELGAACSSGADCASGVCVKESGRQYCSRPCDSADHCPTHYRCTATKTKSVCVAH
jgi:hypothetical protein